MTAPDLAGAAEALQRVPLVRQVVVLEETTSTNDEVRRLSAEGAPEGTVVLAGRQTAGRGRLGRSWHSPAGAGLYVSVLFRPRRPVHEIARWTLAAAVAACEACEDLGYPEVEVKWPNDLVARGRKLAGILAELRTDLSGRHDLVVGAGFNVGHGTADFPAGIRDTAISLALLRQTAPPSRPAVAMAWLARLDDLARALAAGDWGRVEARWRRRAPGSVGHRVLVKRPAAEGGEVPGTTRGVDPSGALRVETDDGAAILVHLGDAVRTLY